MRRSRLLLVGWILAAALTLSGCGGGAVAVGSGFPPPPAAPPPGASGVHGGISVSGGGGLGLAVVIGLALADGIYWAAKQLQVGGGAPAPSDPRRASLWQPMDRGWVDRGP